MQEGRKGRGCAYHVSVGCAVDSVYVDVRCWGVMLEYIGRVCHKWVCYEGVNHKGVHKRLCLKWVGDRPCAPRDQQVFTKIRSREDPQSSYTKTGISLTCLTEGGRGGKGRLGEG